MTTHATVLFGDVVDSRRDPGSTAFLRALREDLDAAYPGADRLAGFAFTQGDEIQGLLAPAADPIRVVMLAALRPDARAIRWAVVSGEVEVGSGPATERTGPAFHAARDVLERARARRDGLLAVTGDPTADGLLERLGPLLPALLEELTDRQRQVARLILLDGMRQSEVAERLAVSRATVSVIAERGRIRHLGPLADALGSIFRDGAARAASAPASASTPASAPAAGSVA
jgi:RNA polymerase sigma factor (sigma-70 family)